MTDPIHPVELTTNWVSILDEPGGTDKSVGGGFLWTHNITRTGHEIN